MVEGKLDTSMVDRQNIESNRAVGVSRYMARLRAIGAYWGLSETIEDWTQE